MRLSTFAARPRRVTLAGLPMLAHKITLDDLAEIEDWMASVVERPKPGEEDIPGGWPPAFDTTAGLSLIATGEGVARLVHVALRRSMAGLTIDQAREISGSIAEDEFGPFYEAIFPEAAEDPGPVADDRPRIDWHARINLLAETYKYTPRQILDLPLDQFFSLGREPERSRPGNWEIPISRPEDLDRLWAERQARKVAEAAEAAGEPGGGAQS